MKVDFYKPKNNILKAHIAGYYFVSEDSNSKPISYLTFPNNYCILSIYQNAEEAFSKNCYIIRPSKENKIVSRLFSKYSKPIEIIYEKLVNAITIYFNPIRINHFIDNSKIFEEAQISDFTPYSDLEEKMELIFNDTCRDRQSKLLEDYLISKFIQKDLTVIERILSDIDAGLRLEYIAEKFNFTRQHINKIFSKMSEKHHPSTEKFNGSGMLCLTKKSLQTLPICLTTTYISINLISSRILENLQMRNQVISSKKLM